ncbi:TrmH family RNA methyltransferase [Candidatus Margulisiibacteriota bacterium]
MIKKIRTLLEKKSARKKEGLFVIEGPHLIEQVPLDRIKYVVYTKKYPILKKIEEKGIPCHKVSEKDYKKATQVVTPQGIMAVVSIHESTLQQITANERSLVLICVNIQDPGNLGAIIRAADCTGVSGIIVTRGTVDVYNQKVIRSTAGSVFNVPIVECSDSSRVVAALKEKGFKIVAADGEGIESFWETDYKENVAVLIGNEGAGIPKEIIEVSDSVVAVPIVGKAESLNAAMCASVIMYEAVRQRGING